MYMDNKDIYLQSQETNVTESDEAVAEDVEINPPLGDSNADDNEINRALETAALFSQEIKSPSPVKVVQQQKRGSSEFGCSGKKIYLYISVF